MPSTNRSLPSAWTSALLYYWHLERCCWSKVKVQRTSDPSISTRCFFQRFWTGDRSALSQLTTSSIKNVALYTMLSALTLIMWKQVKWSQTERCLSSWQVWTDMCVCVCLCLISCTYSCWLCWIWLELHWILYPFNQQEQELFALLPQKSVY